MKTTTILALALATCELGCGVDPEQACWDATDAFADSAAACGLSYLDAYGAFMQGVGSCNEVTSIRDADSFYEQCIPFLRGFTCQSFADPDLAARLPPACLAQLQR